MHTDTERLDWLIESRANFSQHESNPKGRFSVITPDPFGGVFFANDGREVIDKAMESQKEKRAWAKYGGCSCMGHGECNFCRERS